MGLYKGLFTHLRSVLETKYRTIKQNIEFWDRDPRPGPCPYSPKTDMKQIEKLARFKKDAT